MSDECIDVFAKALTYADVYGTSFRSAGFGTSHMDGVGTETVRRSGFGDSPLQLADYDGRMRVGCGAAVLSSASSSASLSSRGRFSRILAISLAFSFVFSSKCFSFSLT